MYRNLETITNEEVNKKHRSTNDEGSNIVEHTLACIRGIAKETANGVHLRQTMRNMMT